MRIAQLLSLIIVVYIVFLFSGYGILIESEENRLGWGLKCEYMNGRAQFNTQYIQPVHGNVGEVTCPRFKKLDIR